MLQKPKSQISVMQDGKRARLYCCHSLLTRDALDELHVLSVGVDLLPALDAQGFDGEAIVGGGRRVLPPRRRRRRHSGGRGRARSAPHRKC